MRLIVRANVPRRTRLGGDRHQDEHDRLGPCVTRRDYEQDREPDEQEADGEGGPTSAAWSKRIFVAATGAAAWRMCALGLPRSRRLERLEAAP